MASFIDLDPNKDLEFRKPFTVNIVGQSLHVINTHPTSSIAFKVKTTAPKQYCVRPNSGRIAANAKTEVQVLLQIMKEDPPDDVKCKDKFLVQAIKIPDDLMNLSQDDAKQRLQELWMQAEQLKKQDQGAVSDVICEKKLKCVYLPSSEKESSQSNPSKPQHEDPQIQETLPTSPTVPELPNQPNLTEKELKDRIKQLLFACEGYKAEIDRLKSSHPRVTTGNKDVAQSPSPTIAQVQNFNPQVVGLIALIAFFLGVLFF